MGRKVGYAFAGLIIFLAGYLFTNHYPRREPVMLRLLEWEERMPFMPWTMWVYWTDYVYLLVVLWLLPEAHVERFFGGFLVLATLHFAIFWFYPTTYPRPKVGAGKGLTRAALKLQWWLDTPRNCFPSLHVAACVYGAIAMFLVGNDYAGAFLVWALLIAVSTLTAKQHYVWDVLSGALLAVVVVAGCWR